MSKGEGKRIISVILTILLLDQSTKFLILKFLSENQSIAIIKNIFHLTLVKNRGAAFGIFEDFGLFLIIISLFIITLILINLRRVYSNPKLKISFTLILSGAVGNLIDRLRYGYIIDFLDFRIWPVFNVADTVITIGAILLGYSMLKSKCIL